MQPQVVSIDAPRLFFSLCWQGECLLEPAPFHKDEMLKFL